MNNVGCSSFNPCGSGKLATPSSKHLSSVSRLIRHRKSPDSVLAKFVMRKSRNDLSSIINDSFSSAIFRPWWIVRLLGTWIARIALRKSGISVRLVPIGETGEMSTTMRRSTRCGYFKAKFIIARPPIEWPKIAAFSSCRSSRNFRISSLIKLYEWSVVWGESPWFLASTLMIFLGGFDFWAKALHKLFLKVEKLCNLSNLTFITIYNCIAFRLTSKVSQDEFNLPVTFRSK